MCVCVCVHGYGRGGDRGGSCGLSFQFSMEEVLVGGRGKHEAGNHVLSIQ